MINSRDQLIVYLYSKVEALEYDINFKGELYKIAQVDILKEVIKFVEQGNTNAKN